MSMPCSTRCRRAIAAATRYPSCHRTKTANRGAFVSTLRTPRFSPGQASLPAPHAGDPRPATAEERPPADPTKAALSWDYKSASGSALRLVTGVGKRGVRGEYGILVGRTTLPPPAISCETSAAPFSHAVSSVSKNRHLRPRGRRRCGICRVRVSSWTVLREHRSRAATSSTVRYALMCRTLTIDREA